MADDQRTGQANTAPQAHIDAVARVLTDHLFTVDASAYGSESCACGWSCDGWDAERYETHLARAVLDSTDPAVHAALLDALTRHGVLTEDEIEPAAEWDSFDDAARGLPGRWVGYRRLVTRWEPTP